MHLPDGSLSVPVWVAGDVVAVAAVGMCVRKASEKLTDRIIPLTGVLGAFVFAAQMINFPVPGGTSGHLLGGVLLSMLLGPTTASMVLFCVFVVQALLFQDGGITVLGPNFINMGLCGTFLGWALVKLIASKKTGWVRDLVVMIACWVSVMAAAILLAVELWLSNNAPLLPVLVTMGSVHAVIGLGEGLITVTCLRFLLSARPELAKELP